MSPSDPLPCEEVFRRLDDYLDRELTPAEMEQVKEHLERCAVCAGEFRFDETVLRLVRARLSRVQAPPGLLGAIRARLVPSDPG
ncbi:MAG: zf-HC2 domain-containing protein [Candidatus Eisenbacteria bacterium]